MITAVITKKGRALQIKQLNGADLVFTRAVAGTARTTVESLQEQTTISNVAQTLSIQSVKLDESKQSYTILLLLENTYLTKSYNLNQIGFYAKDPNDGEILFAVAQFDTPKKIEVPTVEPGYTLEMPFTFQNSGNANVTVDFNPDNLMSRAGVEAMLNNEEISKKASGNPVTVEDSSESPFLDFKLFGKSEHETTKGYNLVGLPDMEETTNNEITYSIKDSILSLNGIWNGTGILGICNNLLGVLKEAANYTLKIVPVSGSWLTGSLGIRQVVDGTQTMYIQHSYEFPSATKAIPAEEINTENPLRIYATVGASFNNFKCKVLLYVNDGIDKEYEKYTGGKAAPNAEFPQEIENTGDSGTVEISTKGANLLLSKTGKVESNGITVTYDEATQILTFNGVCTEDNTTIALYRNIDVNHPLVVEETESLYSKVKYISGSSAGYFSFRAFDANWSNSVLNTTETGVKADLNKVVSYGKRIEYAKVDIRLNADSVCDNLKVKLMLSKQDADYEPYKVTTANISLDNPLRGIPVPSGGNYTDKNGQEWICDEINLAKRKYIQRVKEIMLDGSDDEVWYLDNQASGIARWIIALDNPYKPASGRMYCLCSHGLYGEGKDTGTCFVGTTGDFYFYKNDITALSNWREWLANNQIRIVFCLNNPIETDLTDEQIAAFESLTAFENKTNIFIDTIGDMEVQYFKDTDNGKAMGILKSEHIYLKKLIGDVNAVVQGLVG